MATQTYPVPTSDLGILVRLLLLFCREPVPDGAPKDPSAYLPTALDRWIVVLPDMPKRIKGKHVIDFGCGYGMQAVRMAERGAAHVVALDIERGPLEYAERAASESPARDRLLVTTTIPAGLRADIITSQNSFEHFVHAEEILEQWKSLLVPGGQALVTFAPPWYSAWGSHMAYFCRLPWVNLLFSEKVVMAARSHFRDDGCRTYKEAVLAKMSIAKFEKLVKKAGFLTIEKRYDCSFGLDFLRHIPLLRELFINRVTAVLQRP